MNRKSEEIESLFLSLTDEEQQKVIDYMLMLLSESNEENK